VKQTAKLHRRMEREVSLSAFLTLCLPRARARARSLSLSLYPTYSAPLPLLVPPPPLIFLPPPSHPLAPPPSPLLFCLSQHARQQAKLEKKAKEMEAKPPHYLEYQSVE